MDNLQNSEEFQKGFDDGFHKGVVQGYIKGHTDASAEISDNINKNSFMKKIITVISQLFKDNLFSNISFQPLLNAIKSLIKSVSTISFPNTSLLKMYKVQPVLASTN